MAIITTNVHPNEVVKAEVVVDRHKGFTTVDVEVRDKNHNNHKVNIFCHNHAEVDVIMSAMAKAVREYYGNAEPEPDWDAIAAEMGAERHMEEVRGL